MGHLAKAHLFAINMALTCLLCCCSRASTVKTNDGIIDLKVGDYAALGSQVPLLIQHDGNLYTFWRGHSRKSTKPLEGIPQFPPELLPLSKNPEWATAAYANRLNADSWSDASLLATGNVECDPKFVWSDGHGLNIIVDLADGISSHFLLNRAGHAWQQIRRFPELADGVLEPLGIQQRGDSVFAVSFSQTHLCFWHYDGNAWHGPLVIEDKVKFDGTWGYFRPRLTVADSGDVHVVWNTQSNPTHVVIRGDKMISKRSLNLMPQVQKGDDLDVAALKGGHVLLAYQADEDVVEARKNSIYICEFDGDKWGNAQPAADGAGVVLGDPQLVAQGDEVLLAWRHRMEVSQRGSYASGPTVSYSVRNPSGAWSAPKPVLPITSGQLVGRLETPTFFTLYCTPAGKVYMTWGGNSVYVSQLHAFSTKSP